MPNDNNQKQQGGQMKCLFEDMEHHDHNQKSFDKVSQQYQNDNEV